MRKAKFLGILLFGILIFATLSQAAPLPSFIETIGSSGSDPGQFDGVQDILFVNDHIYVSEELNDRVQIFDLDWNYIDQFGGLGAGNGQFNNPIGMDSDGERIFVADASNDRIQIFNLDGGYLDQFGTPGTGNGELSSPIDILLHEGKLYVSEYGNDRISVFNATDNSYISKITSDIAPTTLEGPRGLEIADNILYVAAGANHDVRMYDVNSGGFLDFLETPNEYYSPWDIKVINDTILVSDLGGYILMFNQKREYIKEIRSDLHNLRFLETHENSLFVSEYTEDQISRFRLVANPNNIQAVSGLTSITVSWNIQSDEGVSDPQYYRVFRSTSSGYVLIAETTDHFFIDATAQSGESYTYKVQAVSSLGKSSMIASNSASIEKQATITVTETESNFGGVPLKITPFISMFIAIPFMKKKIRK